MAAVTKNIARSILTGKLIVGDPDKRVPPILTADGGSPKIRGALFAFLESVPRFLETWLTTFESRHTRRLYLQDMEAFLDFFGCDLNAAPVSLFYVSHHDVREYRRQLTAERYSASTIKRRLSSVSSFYKHLATIAAEQRLPTLIPNPVYSYFKSNATMNTRHARPLPIDVALAIMEMAKGDSVIAVRDAAILKFYLYSGMELVAGCRLQIADLLEHGSAMAVRVRGRGNRFRTIRLHDEAALAITRYIEIGNLRHGFLFRRRRSSRSQQLSSSGLTTTSMYSLIRKYLAMLPRDTTSNDAPRYTPRSLRATTKSLLVHQTLGTR